MSLQHTVRITSATCFELKPEFRCAVRLGERLRLARYFSNWFLKLIEDQTLYSILPLKALKVYLDGGSLFSIGNQSNVSNTLVTAEYVADRSCGVSYEFKRFLCLRDQLKKEQAQEQTTNFHGCHITLYLDLI